MTEAQTMNVNRETRRAIADIVFYLGNHEDEKACAAMDLLNEMLDTVNAGEPKPWAWFELRQTERELKRHKDSLQDWIDSHNSKE